MTMTKLVFDQWSEAGGIEHDAFAHLSKRDKRNLIRLCLASRRRVIAAAFSTGH